RPDADRGHAARPQGRVRHPLAGRLLRDRLPREVWQMIAEFALTPSLFDPAAHDDRAGWLEQLTELKSGMFPPTAVSPVLVSDLAGGWRAWVEHLVKNINKEDQRVRVRVQDLLTKASGRLVRRAKRTNGELTDENW